MLETAITDAPLQENRSSDRKQRAVFKMKTHDRMAGSVPVWEKPTTAKGQITARLAQAGHNTQTFDSALSYAAQQDDYNTDEEPFGFGDLIDMVNPLHHIPLVSTIYREITGDTIRPASRIIGGTVFGGALGAASSIANTIVEYETGRDIPENLIGMATGQQMEKPHITYESPVTAGVQEPEQNAMEDLPGTVLRYTDLGLGKREVERRAAAPDNRTAGFFTEIKTEMHSVPKPERESITKIKFEYNG